MMVSNGLTTSIRSEAREAAANRDQQSAGARNVSTERLQLDLSHELTGEIRKLALRQNSSPLAVMLTGWVALLGRWGAEHEVVAGIRCVTVESGDAEAIIGGADSTSLRVQLQDDATVQELIDEVNDALINACVKGTERRYDSLSRPSETGWSECLTGIVISTNWRPLAARTSDVPIEQVTLQFRLSSTEESEPLHGVLEYDDTLFYLADVERMISSWKALLEGMLADVHQPVRRLSMLSSTDRDQVLYGFNDSIVPFPHDRLIHELFEDQVDRQPEAIALIFDEQSLTFSELNCRSNKLARYLRERGVSVDQLVGVCVERSLDMVVAMLAVWKVGGAFVPLDPAYPKERLQYLLRDAAPRILVTQDRLRGRIPETAAECIYVDSDWSAIATQDDSNISPPALRLSALNLAYVVYTSGSTGAPKGAMNEHRGMVNRIVAQRYFEDFSDGDICCQKTSIGFVDAIFETFGPLCCGYPLVIIPAATVHDSEEMAALIARKRVTRLVTVPSLARAMLESPKIMRDLSGLRSWTLSGEEVRADLLTALQVCLPRCEFIMQYGSSEVSSDAAIYKSRKFEGERVPLGRPIPNVQAYILDRYGEPVPIGVPGEICVGGVGVGRGYLKRLELTAERFVRDRFGSYSQARLYKTGDLGRWRPDGMLEYLGRADNQVKIRGFRIELGEIEAQLLRHANVRDAVVLAREDRSGEKRLIAYVTLRNDKVAADVETIGHADSVTKVWQSNEARSVTDLLRTHLKDSMPEHMVPAAFVLIETMPRTPNGKIDRRALPAPGANDYLSRPYEAPMGETEQVLARVWQELLRIDRVGRRDNFFELGGHSLLIVQMRDRLRSASLSVEARDLYDHPILADLAAVITEVEVGPDVPQGLIPSDCHLITPQMLPLVVLAAEDIASIAQMVPGGMANIQDIYPLAPLQEGILFHHFADERAGDTYVQPTLFHVCSRRKLSEFINALNRVIERHDVLRTSVHWQQLPRPVQVVHRQATLAVDEIELDRERDPVEQLRSRGVQDSERMDLRRAPLMRVQVASEPSSEGWYVLLRTHHLVFDDESLQTMFAEVKALIEGDLELPEPVPYRNHIARVIAYAGALDADTFFRDELRDIDEPTAPFGLLDVHGSGSNIDEDRRVLDEALERGIRAQARRLGVSAATLFHAAWGVLVARTSGRNDVVFGTVLSGRLQSIADARRTLGMFINTLPLRLRLVGTSVSELVEQTSRGLVELMSHEHASLATAQRCSRISGSAPLFTTLLNYRHGLQEISWDPAVGVRLLFDQDRTNYPITLSVDDTGDGFVLTAQTQRIEARRIVGYMEVALRSLVDALQSAGQSRALALNIMPSIEFHLVTKGFNATQAIYPREKLIHELFEEQVQRTPGALAVIDAEAALTYIELNRRANQLAWWMRKLGVDCDHVVGICVRRSVEMVVALLATLKAGGAYVALDPSYPPERLTYMLSDVAPKVLITQEAMLPRLPGTSATIVNLDRDLTQIAGQPEHNVDKSVSGMSPDRLAYIIYTSGSTGQPKGIGIEHRNTVNLIYWALSAMSGEMFAQSLLSTSLNFDLSVYECFVPIATGGCVRVVENALALANDPGEVTLINTVPSAIQGLLESESVPKATRIVNLAGEPLKEDLVKRLFSETAVEQVWNLYGPSETTTYSTSISMPRATGFKPTIGRPIANTQIYILDAQASVVPIGVAGEIYIGGAGVARGYLNRPALTAERFVGNAFSVDSQNRLYRTGDLGRWRVDGSIEYLGRNDHQVKIRGFRVELGEIESRIAEVSAVKEVVVTVREDVPGDRRLVAYITQRPSAVVQVATLHEQLKAVLPGHMVPAALMVLDQLPLTPNGKIDRKALPAPEVNAYVRGRYEAPRGEMEEALERIWRDLLAMERVGRYENFFELGGHSLLIVQMMERLRRLGLSVDVRRVFESASLAELANALTTDRSSGVGVPPNRIPSLCERITPQMLPLVELSEEHIEQIVQSVPGHAANVQDVYPLAPMQEGIVFHHLLGERAGDPYVLPILLSISTRSRLDRFIWALQQVVDRHDALRTAVLWEQLPQPLQVVLRQAAVPVQEIELDRNLDPLTQMKERMRPERQRLDLQKAPLLQLQIARDPGSSQWYALLQLHHLAQDHGSLDMMLEEVIAHVDERATHLPKPMPYRNHVAHTLAHSVKYDEAFFRSKLEDLDEPTTPFGLNDVHGDGSRIDEMREELEFALARRIRNQARHLGVSSATLFHAAWALVVSRTSGRDDIVFGTLLLGRLGGSAGTERTLGMFINTLPLRLRLQGISARQLVELTQRELIELVAHEQASLAVAQRCSGIAGSAPLFSALLNFRHSPVDLEADIRAEGIRVLADADWTNYPLTLSVDDQGEGFRLTAQTERPIEPDRIIRFIKTTLVSLLDALEQAPGRLALQLSILPEDEREQVIEHFNETEESYPRGQLVHGLFEQQVQLTPHSLAVRHEGRSTTYAELNTRADQLARYLREKGVGLGHVVGICAERSIQMVAGVLAILKAGAAYLPLDPSYPADRLQYMLRDAGPRVVLTQGKLSDVLRGTDAELIDLDRVSSSPGDYVDGGGAVPEHESRLLYVIYTSGSTGRPKGIAMPHCSMTNLIEWHRHNLSAQRGAKVLQFAALSFDVAFQEIFSTLCTGGALVLVDELIRKDATALNELLVRQSVEKLFLPPLMLQSLAEHCAVTGEKPTMIKDIITAGEQLNVTAEIVELFRQLNGCRLHNHYGPTETHVVTSLTLSGDPETWPKRPMIGRPISNTQIYVLDRELQPLPRGVTGEIYIGGANVSRGYLNRPELTSARFLPNPFSADPAARIYRTGDLGRWCLDGVLEYVGRNDDQVKIRGFRIELQEIERQLTQHVLVKDAAVLVREDVPGDRRLVAYVTPRDQSWPTAEELRVHVKLALPEHMVPSAFVTLESLPLTSSGKLDRRALPPPEMEAFATQVYEPPQGEVEETIATIWRELLQVERVGRQDNFFELGGHSLHGMKLIAKLEERLTVKLSVISIFQYPTVGQMADAVRSLVSEHKLRPEAIEFDEGIL